MSYPLDETHDRKLGSWVESANDPASDFPIQNLPFGRFRRSGESEWRIGVAIGDQVLGLREAGLVDGDDMNALMQTGAAERRKLRVALSQGLRSGSPERGKLEACLVSQSSVELGLPCAIGDYTDFYTSIHHATTVGKLFRPDNPLLPNYKWVPIGYHGRASSIVASGHDIARPSGQLKGPDDAAPRLAPTQRLDYELELGAVIGKASTLGEPVPLAQAEDYLFGLALFNDWTARDIQAWEYQPLGPFLSKNFASTLSPWIVTMEALAPYRVPFGRPSGDPDPLPYLESEANRAQGAIDIALEVWLSTAAMRSSGQPAQKLMQSNFANSYWTLAQLVAHHTITGCNLRPGDLFGSGTQSGSEPGQGGSMLELTLGGRSPLRLANGETRAFLQDGDTVFLRGHCQRDGFARIGFGECSGTIVAIR